MICEPWPTKQLVRCPVLEYAITRREGGVESSGKRGNGDIEKGGKAVGRILRMHTI